MKTRQSPKTIGVLGCGRFGLAVVEELLQAGHKVIAVDENVESLDPLLSRCRVVMGNAEDEDILSCMQIVRTVIVAFSNDESVSNHAVVNCKELGLYVMARAQNKAHGKILQRLGADCILYPETNAGVELVRTVIPSVC